MQNLTWWFCRFTAGLLLRQLMATKGSFYRIFIIRWPGTTAQELDNAFLELIWPNPCKSTQSVPKFNITICVEWVDCWDRSGNKGKAPLHLHSTRTIKQGSAIEQKRCSQQRLPQNQTCSLTKGKGIIRVSSRAGNSCQSRPEYYMLVVLITMQCGR